MSNGIVLLFLWWVLSIRSGSARFALLVRIFQVFTFSCDSCSFLRDSRDTRDVFLTILGFGVVLSSFYEVANV